VNLEKYRSSFTIFTAISDVNLSAEVARQLNGAGYVCEQRLNYESLNEEVRNNPPHVIILSYGDEIFFREENSYGHLIQALAYILPETQIIVL